MEYEFQRNRSTGILEAHFSMGQEVLGFWFVEELGECSTKYNELSMVIDKLQNHQLKQWTRVGKALSIELDNEQVRVFANDIDNSDEFELEEAMSFYDGESEAFCGLEDFKVVLASWWSFVDNEH